MKTHTLILAVVALLGLGFGPSARADLELDIASAVGANIQFTAAGTDTAPTFQFNNNSSGQGFSITNSSGAGDSVGLFGAIGGTFGYTSIQNEDGGQYATVTSNGGSLTITDLSNVSFTGSVAGVDLFTSGTSGIVNLLGTINLTNVAYSGTNADLQQLTTEAGANGGTVSISFTLAAGLNLTTLAASGSDPLSYAGSIVTTGGGLGIQSIAPEPSSLAIAGIGALGLIGFGLRRRNASIN